ncbi:MAG: hypothetical protein HOP07_07545 [Bacteriovoracaceae bacterium]|nr:hypothetical protein [Bacteriovoracaceae bacterium]
MTISNTSGPVFKVNLKPKLSTLNPEFHRCFSNWLISEECLKRNYAFYDYGAVDALTVSGFCYKENVKFGLGVSFNLDKIENKPPSFIVKGMGDKIPTSVKENDQFLKFNDEVLQSMLDIKLKIFNAYQKGKKSIKISLIRNHKIIDVEESIIAQDGLIQAGSIWSSLEYCQRPNQ